jgi:hypothetical protein
MSWQTVDPHAPLATGGRYRSRYYFKLPYNPTISRLMIDAVFAGRPALRLAGIDLVSASTLPPSSVEQTAGGRYERWELRVEWRKVR